MATQAHQNIHTPAAQIDRRLLTPPAACAGYVPASDLGWLEALRERHERLAARLAEAVLAPDRERAEHAAAAAAWRERVRAAARLGEEPPEHDVRLGPDYLAGRVDGAEATIAALAGEVLALLIQADAACDEHGIDAIVELADDGYGGVLAATERRLAGDAALPAPPLWAASVRVWRGWYQQRVNELRRFGRRDGAKVDPNPFGGSVRGTTLEDHAAAERRRASTLDAAEQIAAAKTTTNQEAA